MGARVAALALGLALAWPAWGQAQEDTSPEAVTADAAPTPPGDPNDSRLMFAPTGRPLGKGNGYFSDHYVLFPGFAYGVTRNLTVAGGFSTIPGVGLQDQVFYVSATAGFVPKSNTALAVGGFLAGAAADDIGDFGVGALFGVATFGSPDRSLTIGLAAVATRDEEYRTGRGGELMESRTTWRFRDAPVVLVGGSLRLARNLSLISESWILTGRDFRLSEQPFGFAVRFFGGRLSADVGVVLIPAVLDEGFPVPWLSFSYHFGPKHRISSRDRNAAAAMLGAGLRRR
jgi:hypothetical protein